MIQRQSLTNSHKQTDALSVSEQWLPANVPAFLPQFLLLRMTLFGMEYLFGSVVQAISSPRFLPTPSLLAG